MSRITRGITRKITRPLVGAPYGGIVVPALYEGAIATNTRVPNSNSGSTPDSICRSAHFTREAITSLSLVYVNWQLNAGRENLPNGSGQCTYQSSVEYPEGVFTPITYATGNPNGIVATGGLMKSDSRTLAIPANTQFWVWTWKHAAVGRVRCIMTAAANTQDNLLNKTLGEGFASGAAGTIPNIVGGGSTIVDTGEQEWDGPAAIVAMTRKASVFIIGDSTDFGIGDFRDASGDMGKIARSVGPYVGYCNAGSPSANLTDHIATHSRQVTLSQFFSDVYCGMGVNDLTFGDPLETIQANMQTVWGYYPGKRIRQMKITPRSGSTDLWATNQTPVAAFMPVRNSLNAWLDTNPSGITAIDYLAAVEESPASCRWKMNGAARFATVDGTHPSQASYIAAGAAFNPAILAR